MMRMAFLFALLAFWFAFALAAGNGESNKAALSSLLRERTLSRAEAKELQHSLAAKSDATDSACTSQGGSCTSTTSCCGDSNTGYVGYCFEGVCKTAPFVAY